MITEYVASLSLGEIGVGAIIYLFVLAAFVAFGVAYYSRKSVLKRWSIKIEIYIKTVNDPASRINSIWVAERWRVADEINTNREKVHTVGNVPIESLSIEVDERGMYFLGKNPELRGEKKIYRRTDFVTIVGRERIWEITFQDDKKPTVYGSPPSELLALVETFPTETLEVFGIMEILMERRRRVRVQPVYHQEDVSMTMRIITPVYH
jgi:hypothetical protein